MIPVKKQPVCSGCGVFPRERKGRAQGRFRIYSTNSEARSKAASVNISSNNVSADDFTKQAAAQDELASATNNLIIRIEKYPTLKGTAAYSGLQTQLEGTERRIKVARKDFNEAINNYNSSIISNKLSRFLVFLRRKASSLMLELINQ
ncbi:MAG: LemA family protein [Chitinophagaceae bacterium]|nr:LemA family protein [Chitinophagaceae bacterium]